MQLKPITAIAVLLLVLASLFVSGCINNVSNPLTSSNSDYSATFAKSLESIGWTPINPISKLSDNVYSGSYKNSSFTFEITIEIAQSEAAAKERYGQFIIAKQGEGFTSQSSAIIVGSASVFGSPVKASWFGYKINSLVSASTYNFLYAHNSEIDEWVVVTVAADTFSQYATPTPIAWATTTVP